MAECSECGKQDMGFSCSYCGENYCSSHRLPENHECEGLEDGLDENNQKDEKWFKEKEVREDLQPKSQRPRKSRSGAKWWANEALKSIKNNATLMIIAITTFVFMIQVFLGSSPDSIPFYDMLVLDPSLDQVTSQPWTVFSVMFLHAGTFHVFANMITLYFFGRPVEKILGSGKFLKFYFGAGLASSLGYIATRNLMAYLHGPEALGLAVGASGAVVACFAAVAMLYPDAEVLLYFIIPMNIKTLLYGFAAFELFNLGMKMAGINLPIVGGLASSAHLTGLLVGFWYGRRLRNQVGNRTSVIDLLGP